MDVTPRGPLSAALLEALREPPHPRPELPGLAADLVPPPGQGVGPGGSGDAGSRVSGDQGGPDTLLDEDLQLSLYLMYELHYGLAGADPGWEWSLDLLGARAVLEAAFEADLRRRWPAPPMDGPVAEALFALTADAARPGPGSTAVHVARRATREQVAELLVQRSVYQLKEADPHTWGIPRLRGRAKAALVDIQTDEYGGGRVERMHATLFATTMRGLGLDDTPNAYLDVVAAPALASVNALSMLGLHARLVGALCGHLAAFEMTSSLPAARWAQGLRRLGVDEEAVVFYDEHVVADAVHEQVATHELCGSLVQDQPDQHAAVLWGAALSLGLDELVGAHARQAWDAGRSALRHRTVTAA